LAKVLEYIDYRKFLNVIDKAKVACENSGEVIHKHFVHMDEMVAIGSGAARTIDTIYLSRYACYLK
jgi:DNA-damage-inducible protein D